jgi:tetraacyldisaccharide 4'-kinase
MDRDAFVEGVLHGGDRGFGATLLRGLLTPLAYLHQVGLEVYLMPYRIGIRKLYRLPIPVIAIGNLSSGGTGKTPMAALVAGHLKQEGKRVVLLSRGHGGSGESGHAPRIVSDGEKVLLGPEEAGDEPTLLANRLPGVPVVVGRDRRRSGRLAVERFAPEIIVLDDALQYWQLHRDLNIVLLDARRPFDNGYVLPRGLLREPPSHLSRAGIVVLTRADRISDEERRAVLAEVHRLAPNADAFTAIHAPQEWATPDGTLHDLDLLAGRSVFAFSGIADGKAFTETVGRLGAIVVGSRDYGDHHAYTPADLSELIATLPSGSIAVTTEKDMVKVGPLWPADAPTLYALRIGMEIDDEPRFFRRVGSAMTGTLPGFK